QRAINQELSCRIDIPVNLPVVFHHRDDRPYAAEGGFAPKPRLQPFSQAEVERLARTEMLNRYNVCHVIYYCTGMSGCNGAHAIMVFLVSVSRNRVSARWVN